MHLIETLLDQVLIYVVSQTDLIKYMLNRLLIIGRIGKWSFALLEFTLVYFSHKSVKGQALADFLPWILKFDGSIIENLVGTRIVIISPRGVKTTLSFNMAFRCTNNQGKYEALVIGLKILL